MKGQKVGIGDTTPSYTLDVGGNAQVTTDLFVGDDLHLTSDASVLKFGAGSDVTFTHDNGTGMDITSAGNLDIDCTAGSVTLGASLADGQTLKLGKNGAVETIIAPHGTAGSELYSVINTAGTTDGADAAGSILLSAVAGGIGLAWADDKDLWAEGGQFVVTANHDAAGAIKLHADAGSSQTILIVNDEGTGSGAITLTATAGGITLNSDSVTLGEGGDTDVVLNFNANTADGVLTWLEDEDVFEFSDKVNIGPVNAAGVGGYTNGLSIKNDTADKSSLSLWQTVKPAAGYPQMLIYNSAGSNTDPHLRITDAHDSNTPAILELLNDRASEADDDVCGTIRFSGNNDNGTPALAKHIYATISGSMSDKTENDEGGKLTFEVYAGATSGATAAATNLFSIGGEDVANSTPCEVIVNDDGIDCDFRVEGDTETHLLYVDAGNERISIGDSVDAPAATLEVTNHASAGAYNVPLVQLNSNDTDQIALDINAANIDADIIDITANALTTGQALDIKSSSLTTGKLMLLDDTSASTGARFVAAIGQNNAAATNAIPLYVLSNGGNKAIYIDKDYTDTAATNADPIFGIHLDFDRSVSSTTNAANTMYGVGVQMDHSTSTAGDQLMYGVYSAPTLTYASANSDEAKAYSFYGIATGGTNGTTETYGAYLKATGADTNFGLYLEVADGGSDLRIVSSADTGDYFQIATTTHGATTISTVDDDSNDDADLTIDVDGKLVFEAKAGDEAVFNEGGLDVDFRVESVDETHMIFVEGSSNRMSIGDSTDAPAATLELTNASDGGVPLFQLNSNDVDKIAVDINAANTTANVIDVAATALTTGKALFIDAGNATTTSTTAGGIVHVDFDKTGIVASGQTSTFIGLDLDMNDAATNVGTSTMTGLDLDVVNASAGGTVKNIGLDLNVSGADTNIAAIVRAGEVHFGAAAGSGTDVKFFTAGDANHIGLHWDADGNTEGTLIGGSNHHGVDFKFFGESSGKYLHWNMAGDELVLVSSAKISFNDAGGDENIVASADGHLEINSGTTLDMTAPTVDVNASTAVTIDTPSVTITDATTSSATEGGYLRLASNDGAAIEDEHRLGVIEFAGSEDGSNTVEVGAKIEAICDDDWGGSTNDANLVFSTTAGTTISQVLELQSTRDVLIDSRTATATGAGITAGTTVNPKMYVRKVNGEVWTTILVDLTGLECGTAIHDVIGNEGASAAYLTKLTTAVNGIVVGAEMHCIELPAGSNVGLDIDLRLSTASLAEDADASAAANAVLLIESDANWALGGSGESESIPTGANAIGARDYYVYLTNGAAVTTGGTYTAGKFAIQLYGWDPTDTDPDD
jgi:hypothetical protein